MGINLLIDRLPETVTVGGVKVPIRTDFRVGMLFEMMMWDRRLGMGEKVAQTLRLYYAEGDLPEDLEGAYRAAMWFFRGGKAAEEGRGRGRRVYCYEKDAEVIYAAFRAQYGVDLQAAEGLHWWAFRAMFMGLWAEHEVCRRMAVRGMSLAGVASREERARLARLKEKYRLEGEEDMAGKAGAVFGGHGG